MEETSNLYWVWGNSWLGDPTPTELKLYWIWITWERDFIGPIIISRGILLEFDVHLISTHEQTIGDRLLPAVFSN